MQLSNCIWRLKNYSCSSNLTPSFKKIFFCISHTGKKCHQFENLNIKSITIFDTWLRKKSISSIVLRKKNHEFLHQKIAGKTQIPSKNHWKTRISSKNRRKKTRISSKNRIKMLIWPKNWKNNCEFCQTFVKKKCEFRWKITETMQISSKDRRNNANSIKGSRENANFITRSRKKNSSKVRGKT